MPLFPSIPPLSRSPSPGVGPLTLRPLEEPAPEKSGGRAGGGPHIASPSHLPDFTNRHMSNPKLLFPLAILLVAILVIAACGADSTPSPSTDETQGEGDCVPSPTHRPGESEWSPPTGQGDADPTPEAPEQPWPQPDLLTPSPAATPTPVPTPDFDPAAYFARSDPTGRNPWRTDFSKHSVDYTEILLGQVRDGIPSIDDPKFAPVSDDLDWLSEMEPVILIEINGDARAYPLQIMTWHEIVNDVVGGEPVIVTFCPLCNTAIAFERRMGNTINSFGVSGLLRYSDLIMYDRATDSWWQQILGEAIVGQLTGARLPQVPASIISWADFRDNYPDGQVLTRDTGFTRQYGQNPYTGYDDINSSPFLFHGPEDGRLRPVERVATVELNGETVAYPFLRLEETPVVNDDIGGTPIVVFHAPGTASALDRGTIANSRDVGATGVFDRRLGDRTLTFRPDSNAFIDEETGSTWNVLGRAVDGPLAGQALTPIVHANHFWFAWAAFKPETRVWGQ